ncbi:MAG TPA: M56 family metallopeptidase [Bryobacteraceae bacterium]|jgi:TonB family protein|nr:M56 family metallopeptidase [Bryobacteraceae bacterium]
MILLLLKVTLLFAITLAATGILRRSSAALRHLIHVCGLAGALLLLLTLLPASQVAVLHISALTAPGASRVIQNGTPRLLPWIWLAGFMFLLGRLAIGYLRVHTPSRQGGVVFTDVSVPVVTGLLRPVILLPRAAERWPAWRMDAALRHETAHIRRKDLQALVLAHLACAVYWFHPLVWVVAAQLRREQENACDDAVILSGLDPASYAEALLASAQDLTSTRLIGSQLIGCHMTTQKTFKSRIVRLLADGTPRGSSPSTLRRSAIVFAAAALTIGLLSGQDADGVYRIGAGISAPKVIYKVDPSYTDVATAAKVAGTVTLQVVVGTDGLAHDIRVISGIGSGLDEQAVTAIGQWRFDPALKDGEPVKVHATIEVNFKLK